MSVMRGIPVVAMVAISACKPGGASGAAPPSDAPLTLSAKPISRLAEDVSVTFSKPLPAVAGEKYWITLARFGAVDGEWGDWHYVAAGASGDTFRAKKAGRFELRLHDGYPRLPFHVIARQNVTIQ
jgi:hypothetical protein